MTLSKSLADLDAVATELLRKSTKKEDNDKLTPDEIAEDSVETKDDTENNDNGEDNEEKDIEKSEDVEEVENEESEENIEKSEDSETVEEDEDKTDDIEKSEDSETVEESEEEVKEDIEKSMKEHFEADDTIAKGMKDSEFFSAVVEVLSKSMSDVQYDILSKARTSEQSTDVLAKSLQAALAVNETLINDNKRLTNRVSKLEKSIAEGFERMTTMIDDLSSQPVGMRKSVKSVSVHDRDFEHSINGTKTLEFDTLNKSQVLSILNNELYTGNQNVTVSDIISYESGAPLRQDLQTLVVNKSR